MRTRLGRARAPVGLLICAGLALAGLLAGCGSSRAALVALDKGEPPDPHSDQLPALPSGELDQPGRFISKEFNNVHYGSEYWDKSTPGADVTDTRMVLYGPGGEKGAWAIYQWSGFTGGLVPNTITVETELSGDNEFWLAFSDYSSGRWRFSGPRDEEYFTYGFDAQTQFASPNGNIYVAVICDREHAALVDKLNLKANKDIDPPAPPSGLSVDQIQTRTAHLFWNQNPDADVLGYKLWQGQSGSFNPGDPGVVLVSGDIDYLTTDYDLTGLEPDTQYYYKLTAFDVAFNESLPSGLCTFKTLVNVPPVPDFSWTPPFIQAGRSVIFDPADTQDPGDDITKHLFSWDFDNDGTFDQVATGPVKVSHSYPARGFYECTLQVDDGEFVRSVTKQFVVSFKYDFYNVGAADGRPGYLNSGDVDAATGRIAVGLTTSGPPGVLYFHNGSWEEILLEDTPGDNLLDVALGPGTLSALTISYEYKFGYADSINWYILEYGQGGWQTVRSGKKGDNVVAHAQLCSAPNGRYSFALTSGHSPVPEHEGDVPPVEEPDFFLNWWHEKANGSFATGSVPFGTGNPLPLEIARENGRSMVCYALSAMHVIDVLDTQVTDTSYHNVPAARSLCVEHGPGAGEIAWLVCTTTGDLYWGDNFGSANNASQHLTPAVPASLTLGLWPTADNEAQFYWLARESNGRTQIHGHDSATADDYDLGHGYGYASNGAGGFFIDGSDTGVYFATQEDRDGQVMGYFLSDGNMLRKEVLFDPSGVAPALGASAPIIFPDGSLSVLFQQMYPTALRANADALNLPPATALVGDENYLIPNDACPTGNGREFLTATVSDSLDLILHRCDDNPTGDEQLLIPGVWHCCLERNPDSGEVLLVYTQTGGKSIDARSWSGGNWGAPQTIVTSSNFMPLMSLASRPGGGFGLAYLEQQGSLKLIEKAGPNWGLPATLTSALVNDVAGLGLTYSPAGDCACVMEQAEAPKGVYLGQRPSGSPGFTWEVVEPTNGNQTTSVRVYYGETGPVVFYYNAIWPTVGFGIRVLEKYNNTWHGELFDFPFYNVPVGTAVDPNGNIVVSGVFGVPAQAVYAVIWR